MDERTEASAADGVTMAPVAAGGAIRIVAWPDPVLDTLGHDPRSRYVEEFWLPTLGPTCVLLLRHLADRFDHDPDGFVIDAALTSSGLGLGHRDAAHTPLRRSINRLVTFGLAHHPDAATLQVRRNVPPIQRHHVRRLPEPIRQRHHDWISATLAVAPHDEIRRRARSSAFVLVEQGADRDALERALLQIGYSPGVVRDALVWAHQRHRDADDIAAAS